MIQDKYILLTIDIEDWFQVENFKPWIPFSSWSSYELRVEKNTHRLLDLFDTFGSTRNPKPETRNPIKATFFILGWIAERLPHLVQEIHSRGHEVASHGYKHNLCTECSSDDLKTDLIHSKKLLEDIIGAPVHGYRAPSFSITNNIFKIIKDCGYIYDSSYNSFNLHGRYGKISLNGIEKKGIAIKLSETFFELPVSNISFKNNGARRFEKVSRFQRDSSSRKKKFLTQEHIEYFESCYRRDESDAEIGQKGRFYERLVIPLGGGSYFRLIPFPLFSWGFRKILERDGAYLFYMHPWEIDPEQPRVNDASAPFKFRHYINLKKTYSKLKKFINHFKRCRFVTCTQYLEEISKHYSQGKRTEIGGSGLLKD